MSNRQSKKHRFLWSLFFLAGLVATPAAVVSVPGAASAAPADQYLIVTCQLPPRVRQIGQRQTRMIPGRVIKTSQRDCAIRGGRFIASDPGSYREVLQAWKTQAEKGDPEAIRTVGELYEDTFEDYAEAAKWYRRAADKGDTTAMLRLGRLYELGRGVEQDSEQALFWYRKATGLGDLVFQSKEEQRIAVLEQEIERLRKEVSTVRDQLRASEKARETAESRRVEAETRLDTLEKEAAGLRQRLTNHDQQIRIVDEALALEQSGETEKLRERIAALEARIADRDAALVRLRAERDDARQSLTSLQDQLAEERKRYNETQVALAAAKAALEAARSAAQAGAQGSSAEIRTLQDRVASLTRAVEERRQSVEQKAGEIARLQTALVEREARITSLEDDLRTAAEERDANRLALENSREELEAMRARLAEAERRLADARRKMEELEQTIASERGRVAAYEQELADLNREIETLSAPQITILSVEGPTKRVFRGADTSVSFFVRLKGRVFSRDNLVLLTINDQPVDIADDGRFDERVGLVSADDVVEIAAIDNQNRRGVLVWRSNGQLSAGGGDEDAAPVLEVVRGPRVGDLSNIDFGTYHALVIGNSSYAQWETLPSALRDAEAVGDMLREEFGFEVTPLRDATKLEILRALDSYRERLQRRDHLLVFYAGHGMYDKDDASTTYWVPAEAGQGESAKSEWIDSRQISEILGAIDASQVLLVVDSCYAGTGDPTRLVSPRSAAQGRRLTEWYRDRARRRSRLVLTSGGNRPVLDGGSERHSVFTENFMRILRIAEGRILSIEDVAPVVREAVFNDTSTVSGSAQQPTFQEITAARHDYGSFFFIPQGGD